MDRFADRLDASRFMDGEPVVVRVVGRASWQQASVPEGVFARLQALAVAYDLHVLRDVITPYAEVTLDPAQAEGALEELEFVADIVRDPVVIDGVASLRGPFAEAARSRSPLTVDWAI